MILEKRLPTRHGGNAYANHLKTWYMENEVPSYLIGGGIWLVYLRCSHSDLYCSAPSCPWLLVTWLLWHLKHLASGTFRWLTVMTATPLSCREWTLAHFYGWATYLCYGFPAISFYVGWSPPEACLSLPYANHGSRLKTDRSLEGQ